jgi:molybdate transport system substrate-binding protein
MRENILPNGLSRCNWCLIANVVLAVALLAGCATPAALAPAAAAPAPAPVVVFAAASLTEAFNEIGAAFTAETGTPVTFNFAGSQQLRAQLEQGAAADVLASANKKEMTAAVASGLIVPGAEQIFARNRLVVIFPRANPGGVVTLADLAKPGLKLVLADKSAPVGQYSLDMLDKMGADPAFGADFKERVLENVVSYEQNVKAVVSKAQLGEADAGVAYATDVTRDAREKVSALDVPDAFNQIVAYPIAALAKSENAGAAAKFVAFVRADAGQAILARHGFLSAGAK